MPANAGEPAEAPTGVLPAGAARMDSAALNQADQDGDSTERPLTDAQVRWRTWAIIGGGAAGIVAYGMNNWWQDGFTGKFQTGNEGWFEQNTSDGGADKLGHAYANYVGTRLLARS